MTPLPRRRFLALAGTGLLGGGAAMAAQEQAPRAGSGETGQLFNPGAAGRSRERVTDSQNDERIQAIEKQLKCTCGCNLDVYTCRTTDFTCTVSPELHKEIVALHESGLSDEEVIEAYLARHGTEFRMAPKPEGFNLAGYLVPGIVVLIAGTILALILRRRGQLAAAAAVAAVAPADSRPLDVAAVDATPEEMDRLRAALAEVEE